MTEIWFYRDAVGEHGPVERDALPALVRSGKVDAATPLRGVSGEADAGSALPRLFALPPPYADALPGSRIWTDRSPHPWRRFFARLLDVTIAGELLLYFGVGAFALVEPEQGTAFFTFLTTKHGTKVEAILAVLATVPANAILFALTGTTLGKAAFGIRVLKDGAPLSFRVALRREAVVWMRGEGLGLPIITLVANAAAYRRLRDTGTTTWDEASSFQVVHRPTSRGSVVWMSLLAALLALITIGAYFL